MIGWHINRRYMVIRTFGPASVRAIIGDHRAATMMFRNGVVRAAAGARRRHTGKSGRHPARALCGRELVAGAAADPTPRHTHPAAGGRERPRVARAARGGRRTRGCVALAPRSARPPPYRAHAPPCPRCPPRPRRRRARRARRAAPPPPRAGRAPCRRRRRARAWARPRAAGAAPSPPPRAPPSPTTTTSTTTTRSHGRSSRPPRRRPRPRRRRARRTC